VDAGHLLYGIKFFKAFADVLQIMIMPVRLGIVRNQFLIHRKPVIFGADFPPKLCPPF
jgi:hypothetical protein